MGGAAVHGSILAKNLTLLGLCRGWKRAVRRCSEVDRKGRLGGGLVVEGFRIDSHFPSKLTLSPRRSTHRRSLRNTTTTVQSNVSSLESNSADSKQRLVSLDVFRGLTVALMILVDDAGKAFPSINHAPWFGVKLADFVMPFFLFVVGVSVSLVFKKVTNRSAATKKVIIRTVWLFLLGVILQGGYFHGRSHLTYGVDLEKIRMMGVLQVIKLAFLPRVDVMVIHD
ncbi:uncharacterized protein LOC142519717 [Primulina tabacum]|uniref:uncharacterized protein LOC142519717 n=1 Tax=Primulina tabacum TaxID=48773 RepID=UPI003F590299